MDPELRARLFTNDTEAWNDERYLLVGAPALGVVGVVSGGAIAAALGLPVGQRLFAYAACTSLAVAIGLTALALIDMEQETLA